VQILVLTQSHARRSEVEDFIADVYCRHYGATVPTFPPTLIALIGSDGQFLCASGLRFAETGFFSECYLDQPIEGLLAQASGAAVRRERIFEVSGLASRAPQRSAQFLRYIVSYGESAGFDWAFFTATARLRDLLRALGLPMLILCDADKRRAQSPHVWGSYYDGAPLVCAISRSSAQVYLNGQVRSPVHA
jgi:Thermostable hemolysin